MCTIWRSSLSSAKTSMKRKSSHGHNPIGKAGTIHAPTVKLFMLGNISMLGRGSRADYDFML